MDNQLIQSFWRGRPLSNVEILSIKSFLAHGHTVVVYAYDEVINLPKGALTRDAREILPEECFFINQNAGFGKGSCSPFSDLFRMALLIENGGWWVDLDVVCLRAWDISQNIVIASSDEKQWGILPNANVLKVPPGNALVKSCFDRLKGRDPAKAGHADGPHTVQHFVKDLDLTRAVAPHWWFNPIQWRYAKYIVKPEEFPFHPRRIKRWLGITERLGRIHAESYAVHLWGEVWTQAGWDRNGRYPARSLFERLKRRHGVA
jgi:hypothetical protein